MEYKLLTQKNWRGHYAHVIASFFPRGEVSVTTAFSSAMFGWLKEIYGENAGFPRFNDGYIEAAKKGAELAMKELAISDKVVLFEKICFREVDTTKSNMALAAYQLVYLLHTGEPAFEDLTPDLLENFISRT